MAQFLRPNGDISTGSWFSTPLWEELDEVTADASGTYITGLKSQSDTFEVSLSSGDDPADNTNHTIRVSASVKKKNWVFTVELLQDTTSIWTSAETTHDEGDSKFPTFVDYTFPVPEASAANITNYAALRIRINQISAAEVPYFTWIELEIPESGTPAQNISSAGAIASLEAFGTGVLAPGAVTISATGQAIASAEAHGATTIAPGAVSLDLAGQAIASAEAHGTATVELVQILIANAIATLEAFGTANVQPGATSISLAGAIASLEAIGTAQLNQNIIGQAIASAEAHGTQIISLGPITLIVGGIASLETLGDVTVTPGAAIIDLTGQAIASLEGFGTATVIVGGSTQNVLPLAITTIEDFGILSCLAGPWTISDAGAIERSEVLITTNTASSGDPNFINLAGADLKPGGYYTATYIDIVSGTGAGQRRRCSSYLSGLNRAFVSTSWAPAPDNTSVYEIYSDAIGTQIITQGATTLLPLAIVSGEAIGNQTVIVSAVNINPIGVPSLEAFGANQINLNINVDIASTLYIDTQFILQYNGNTCFGTVQGALAINRAPMSLEFPGGSGVNDFVTLAGLASNQAGIQITFLGVKTGPFTFGDVNLSQIEAGNWTVPLNITTANANIRLDSIIACGLNNGISQVLGSVLPNELMDSTGLRTYDIVDAAELNGSITQIQITYLFTNLSASEQNILVDQHQQPIITPTRMSIPSVEVLGNAIISVSAVSIQPLGIESLEAFGIALVGELVAGFMLGTISTLSIVSAEISIELMEGDLSNTESMRATITVNE